MSEPDLFVVCKNCSSEVSPYVTECPYCGQRVRKRAPRIDKGAAAVPARRRLRTALPRLRRDEIPGIAPETTPHAVGGLIALSLAATVATSATARLSTFDLGAIFVPLGDEWWRLLATPFLHENLGYQFVALVATAVFGTHIERRFGPVAAVVAFVLAGTAGAAFSVALDVFPVLGANGAALGLLCAWLVDDILAARRGDDRGNDLLGVYVFAAVLVLLSLAEDDASIAAAAGGALAGSLLGVVLATLRR